MAYGIVEELDAVASCRLRQDKSIDPGKYDAPHDILLGDPGFGSDGEVRDFFPAKYAVKMTERLEDE